MTKLLTMCNEMDIPIVTASDENYVPCLKVMIRSVWILFLRIGGESSL